MTKSKLSYEELEIQYAILKKQIKKLSVGKAKAEEDSEILNMFLEHSPIYFILKDEKARNLKLSKNFEALVGIPVKKMLGLTNYDIYKTETSKARDEQEIYLVENNISCQYIDEVFGRIASSFRFPIQLKGKPRYLAGYAIDETEKIIAERALKENEEKFRILFNSIPNPVLIIEKQTGKIIEINDDAITQYGYSREELINHDVAFIISEAGAVTINSNNIEDLFLKKFHKKKNGDVFPVSINIISFNIKNDEFLIMSVHDISNQVLLEQNRKEINEKNYLDTLKEMENRLNSLNQQLITKSLNLDQQKSISNDVLEMLTNLDPNADDFRESVKSIQNKIQSCNTYSNTDDFQIHINSINIDFLKKLKKLNLKFSTNEINLCSYLNLNLSTKEISKITHQSTRSIEVARYKLRKKLNLANDVNLNLFLASL